MASPIQRFHFNLLALAAASVSSPAYGLLPRSTASTVARVLAAGPSGSVALSSNVAPTLDPTPRHRSKVGAGGATFPPAMGNMSSCGQLNAVIRNRVAGPGLSCWYGSRGSQRWQTPSRYGQSSRTRPQEHLDARAAR